MSLLACRSWEKGKGEGEKTTETVNFQGDYCRISGLSFNPRHAAGITQILTKNEKKGSKTARIYIAQLFQQFKDHPK